MRRLRLLILFCNGSCFAKTPAGAQSGSAFPHGRNGNDCYAAGGRLLESGCFRRQLPSSRASPEPQCAAPCVRTTATYAVHSSSQCRRHRGAVGTSPWTRLFFTPKGLIRGKRPMNLKRRCGVEILVDLAAGSAHTQTTEMSNLARSSGNLRQDRLLLPCFPGGARQGQSQPAP